MLHYGKYFHTEFNSHPNKITCLILILRLFCFSFTTFTNQMCHTKDFLHPYNQNGATVSLAANIKWAICLYLLPSWLISTQQKQQSHWLVLLITLPVRPNQKTNLNLFTAVSPPSYYVHSHDSLCLETTTKIMFTPWCRVFKQFSHGTLTLSEEQRRLERRRSPESVAPCAPLRQSMQESVGEPTYCQASGTAHASAAVSKINSLDLLRCAEHAGVSAICNRCVGYNHVCTWWYLPEETVLQRLQRCCHRGQELLLLAINCLPEKGVSVTLSPLISVC